MMSFNIDLMLGFLIWTVFCLTMLIVEHFRARKWKRIAKEQARALGLMRRRSKLWDSIPMGVMTHRGPQLSLQERYDILSEWGGV